MTSIPFRIGALITAAASAAALVLATAGPAAAVTGPTIASREQAGYVATGAQFRYVQASFTLPDPTSFATEIDGFGYSVHLWSAPSVIVLGISDGTTGGNYSAAAAVFNPATQSTVCSTAGSGTPPQCTGTPTDWTDGSVSFAPGDFVTESIFYSQSAGTTQFTVTDKTSGQSLTYTRPAGVGISWNQARVGAEFGCTPWAGCGGPIRYTSPPETVPMARFTGIRLTTFSGHRSGFRTWWTHSKVEWTRNGQLTGAVNAKAVSLSSPNGTAFSVDLEP
jgi:hypothetical protein